MSTYRMYVYTYAGIHVFTLMIILHACIPIPLFLENPFPLISPTTAPTPIPNPILKTSGVYICM